MRFPRLADDLPPRRVKTARLCFMLGMPLGFGILSLLLRQDYNWDLLNYHYYNPFAWLNDRYGHDIDAAVTPNGHFNPLLHLPWYLAIGAVPPMLIGFAIGAVQGLNAILLFAIARAVLPGASAPRRDLAALALAFIGMLGAGNLSEIGTSFADNILSLPVLGGLLLLVVESERLAQGRIGAALAIAAGAGMLVGLVAGLKPTMWLYAVGMGFACLSLPATPGRRVAIAAAMSTGALAGAAASGGFWMLELWRRYGNPMFPFFNNWFRSPWAAPLSNNNLTYLPKDFFDALTRPLRFPFNHRIASEIRLVDWRIPLLYALGWVAIAAAVLAAARTRLGAMARADAGRSAMLLAWLAGSFAAWLVMFGIYRYAVAIEMLAPVGIVLLLDRMGLGGRRLAGTAAIAMLGLIATTRVAGWGHVPWSAHHFGVEPPALADPARTLVVLPATEPTGFVVPFFPREVRFVRVSRWPPVWTDPPTGMERLAFDIVARHDGPIYALFRSSDHYAAMEALGRRSLALRRGACERLVVHAEMHKRDGLLFCALDRIAKAD